MEGQGRGRRRARGVIGLTVAAALLAPAATAATEEQAQFTLELASREPGTATAMHLRAVVPNRNGKPPRLLQVVYTFPSGMVLDGSVVPPCQATDDELMAQGTGACPAESKVGQGTIHGVTGFGPPVDPLAGDVNVFQGVGELLEVVSPPGSDRVIAIDHARIGPGTLTANPPEVPGGPPDGHTTIRDVDLRFPQRTVGGRPFLRTPPECPDPQGWVSQVAAKFDTGEVVTASSTTPCRTAAGTIVPPPKRLRLTVTPRRVAAGRRVRFRLGVTGPAQCVAAAVVRFHGRTWRTGRDGRRAVRARFVRPGRRLARVSAKGCRSATAAIRVV